MRSAGDFRHVVRQGTRVGRPTLVVHAARSQDRELMGRVGFVVAKPVGNAVTRNRVKRRLRHLVLAYLPGMPRGTEVVVRALPRAASHPAEVARDLERAWPKALGRVGTQPPEGPQRDGS